jgi:hypothetical protein
MKVNGTKEKPISAMSEAKNAEDFVFERRGAFLHPSSFNNNNNLTL